MTNVEKAFLIAERGHFGQTYDDIYPYMYHIRKTHEVAVILGYDETIQVGCILHDIIEQGNLSYNDVKLAFGVEVAEIVYAVTDELGRNRVERHRKTYHKIRENWKAVATKLCDRIANVMHGIETGSSQLKMYEKEHDSFKTSLMSQHHNHEETNKAWRMLNKLMMKNEAIEKD